MAPASIKPGEKWNEEIRNNLKESRLVLFLASRAACASHYVNQELGGQWLAGKKIIPIIWDISPEELPGWMKDYQVIDLRKGLEALRPALNSIVIDLKSEKNREGLFLVAVIGFLIWLTRQKE